MDDWLEPTSRRLMELYEQPFGGKVAGRFRISGKLLRKLAGRRRFYETDITALSRMLTESGFTLIDMDTYYVVTTARTFNNYRRVGEACLR